MGVSCLLNSGTCAGQCCAGAGQCWTDAGLMLDGAGPMLDGAEQMLARERTDRRSINVDHPRDMPGTLYASMACTIHNTTASNGSGVPADFALTNK